MTQYPYGYGTGRISLAGLESMFANRMHPEFRRRLFAWIESKGGAIGIGGGWRPNPSNTSPASRAGHSFHQTQRFASGFSGYAAVDLVHVNGSAKHRAPTWDEVPKQGSGHADIARFGVHANVNGEPWHLQCREMDAFFGWRDAGRADPKAGYGNLSGHHPTVNPGDGEHGFPPFDPSRGLFSLWPLNDHKPDISKGSRGDAVRYAQGVIQFKAGGGCAVDGAYESQTKSRVKDLQRFFGVSVDGKIGHAETWPIIDLLSST